MRGDRARLSGSVEVHEGPEIRLKESFVGPNGLAVGEGREVVAEQSLLLARAWGPLDPGADGLWQETQGARMGGDEVLRIGGEEAGEDVAALELDLLKRGGFEYEIDCDSLMQRADFAEPLVDHQFEAVSIGEFPDRRLMGCDAAGLDELSDPDSRPGFVATGADFIDQIVKGLKLESAEVFLLIGPFAEAVWRDEAGLDPVHDVVQGIGGIVGPVHYLAFDAFPGIDLRGRVGRQVKAIEDESAFIGLFVIKKMVVGEGRHLRGAVQ